jgi:hypothetical protein
VNLIGAGRVLLVRDRRMGTHLWFVLSDPEPSTQLVVIVALVTERAHTEKTVRLNVGVHPFIKHRSSVDFGAANHGRPAIEHRQAAGSIQLRTSI